MKRLIISSLLLLTVILSFALVLVACDKENDEPQIPVVDYAIENNYEYDVLNDENYLTYVPKDVKTPFGLLFYVGTAISANEYDYLASALAKQGYLVVINKTPLAYVMYNQEEPTFETYSEVKFFFGGHSQGGGAAVKRAKENLDKAQGLVLLAPLAYKTDSIADQTLPTLLLEATKDGVLTSKMKEESKSALPAERTEYLIEGAHMSFSSWDEDNIMSMFKDGPVTAEVKAEQKRLTVEYVLAFLKDSISRIPMAM